MIRKCRLCKSTFTGRSDKKFCSVKCKTSYNHRLRSTNKPVTSHIDTILHRNRTILLEVLGKRKAQIKVPISVLEKKKFNFTYITKYYINSKGKMYHYVYDFSWMTFSDSEVLINRRTP